MSGFSLRGLSGAVLPVALAALLLWALCATLLMAAPRDGTGEMLVGARAFASMIEWQGLVPPGLTHALAWCVLIGEGILAALLMFAPTTRAGLRLLAGFMLVASVYLVAVRVHHGPVTCSCFGGITPSDLGTLLARNGAVLIAALAGLWLVRGPGEGISIQTNTGAASPA